MISIRIEVSEAGVFSQFDHENTTLKENSLAVREIEDIKLQLLYNFKYKPELEVFDDDEES